jgi:hypothetical protein
MAEENKEENNINAVKKDSIEKKENVEEKTVLSIDGEEKICSKEVVDSLEDLTSIFVGEADTFDIKVRFYKKEGNIFVEEVDESFDKDCEEKNIKYITITLKYPSHGDISRIFSYATKNLDKNVSNLNVESLGIREFLVLEFARFVCLVRNWSIKTPINAESILKLNPKIVKGILAKIRNEIKNEGII